MANGDGRITLTGFLGYLALGMGLLFLAGVVVGVVMNYEMSAIFGIVIYGSTSLLLLFAGYKLHYPKLTDWKTALGFVMLSAAIFGSYFLVVEGISRDITERLQISDAILWVILVLLLASVGLLLVRSLLETKVSLTGIAILEAGLILISISFSALMYQNTLQFTIIATPGLILAIKGYRMMRQMEKPPL